MLRPKNKTFHRKEAHVICGFYKAKPVRLIIVILFSEACHFKNVHKSSSVVLFTAASFFGALS